MGSSVLSANKTDQAITDHNLYFRPRPALERDWFQMPKPPKLAYQREQFFANLLRKANPRGGKLRRSRTVAQKDFVNDRLGRTAEEQQRPRTTEYGRRPNTSDGTQQATMSQRMTGGFAGIKLTRPSTSPGSAPSPCMRYSTQRVVQPEDALNSSTKSMNQMSHYKYETRPPTSTIALVPYDVQVSSKTTASTNKKSDAEKQTEAEKAEEEKRWLDMSNMTECHHRELSGMKSEIELLRKELEQGLIARGSG